MFKTLRKHLGLSSAHALNEAQRPVTDSAPLPRAPSQPKRNPNTTTQTSVHQGLHAQLLAKVEQCYLHAETTLNRSFIRPDVSFALRGRSAGTAHLQQNRLRFNPVLLNENTQSFIDEVVPHEICHLLCYQLWGRVKPHGKEWQGLMQHLFQLMPRTTHSFDTASLTSNQINYYCACGIVPLGVRRHNKVQRGQTQYRCKKCLNLLSATPV